MDKIKRLLKLENCRSSAIRNNEYISFEKREFRELALQSIIVAIAANLGIDAYEQQYQLIWSEK